MNINNYYVYNGLEGSWFSTKKLLPEDDDFYEVLTYNQSNGILLKKYAAYNKKLKRWKEKQKNKIIPVIAWKKVYK